MEGQAEQEEEELQIVEEEHAAVQTEWRPAGGDQEEELSFTREEKQARREEGVEESQSSEKVDVFVDSEFLSSLSEVVFTPNLTPQRKHSVSHSFSTGRPVVRL